MSTSCASCGGLLGRDCFNPVECADITRRMEMDRPYLDVDRAAPTEAMLDAPRGLFLYLGGPGNMPLGEFLSAGGWASAGLTDSQLAFKGVFPKAERALMVWNMMRAARSAAA